MAVLGRAIAYGAAAGTLVGAIVQTCYWPIVGTFFGALAGAVAGSVVGAANGLVLAGTVRFTRSRWAARGVATAVSAACGSVVPSYGVLTRGWTMAICGGLGLLLGPVAALGARPLKVTLRRVGYAWPEAARRIVTAGALLGGAVGAVAGLVIGLVTYPLTAAAAIVEGACFGAINGIGLGLLTVAVVVGPRLRSGR